MPSRPCLTNRRKFLILVGRQKLREGVEKNEFRLGGSSWVRRLFDFIQPYDNGISMADLQRWIRTHHWITDMDQIVPGMLRHWDLELDKVTRSGCSSPSYPFKGELEEDDVSVSQTYSGRQERQIWPRFPDNESDESDGGHPKTDPLRTSASPPQNPHHELPSSLQSVSVPERIVSASEVRAPGVPSSRVEQVGQQRHTGVAGVAPGSADIRFVATPGSHLPVNPEAPHQHPSTHEPFSSPDFTRQSIGSNLPSAPHPVAWPYLPPTPGGLLTTGFAQMSRYMSYRNPYYLFGQAPSSNYQYPQWYDSATPTPPAPIHKVIKEEWTVTLGRFTSIYESLMRLSDLCREYDSMAKLSPYLDRVYRTVERNHKSHVISQTYSEASAAKQQRIKEENKKIPCDENGCERDEASSDEETLTGDSGMEVDVDVVGMGVEEPTQDTACEKGVVEQNL